MVRRAEREARDVDFLDRAPRVLQPVERRLGDQLEAGGAAAPRAARAASIFSRAASCSRSASENADTGTPFAAAATSLTRATAADAAGRDADDADLASRRGPR